MPTPRFNSGTDTRRNIQALTARTPLRVCERDAMSLMTSIRTCVAGLQQGKLTRRQSTTVIVMSDDILRNGYNGEVRLDAAISIAWFCRLGAFDVMSAMARRRQTLCLRTGVEQRKSHEV